MPARTGKAASPSLAGLSNHLLFLWRLVGIGTLSGLIAGIITGGIGGRVVMRIIAVAGGSAIAGQITENGNIVGEVTAGGTLEVLVFGGVLFGVFGGILYVAIGRRLPGSPRWKGLAFGTVLLLTFGGMLIEGAKSDFSRFVPLLSIGLFASLFLLFGLAIVPIAQRVGRSVLPVSSITMPTRSTYVRLAIASLPLIVWVFPALEGFLVALGLPVGVILLIALLEWSDRSSFVASHRKVSRTLGYVLLAIPCVLGLVSGVRGISNILSAAG